MKVAAIDIGTNSSRLLIVDVKNAANFKVLKRDLITTRLGAGVDQNKKLKTKAINRVVQAVGEFNKAIKNRDVQNVKIVGTSALRDVKNSHQLINEIQKKFNYELEVISGLKEARLIYQGVKTDISFSKFLLIDIGGGSTEFIQKNNQKVKYKSLNLGAVRITENNIPKPEDKLTKKQINSIKNKVINHLNNSLNDDWQCSKAVGVGGTITTACAVKYKLKEYNSQIVHKSVLTSKDVGEILYKLASLKINQRRNINGLQPERADIIAGGLIILKTILDYFNLNSIFISENDILLGIVREIIKHQIKF